MQRTQKRYLYLALALAAGLASCDSLKQDIPASLRTSPSESPSAIIFVTPSPIASAIRNTRIVSLFDVNGTGSNGGTIALAPWLTFATGALSFSGGDIAIQQRVDAGGALEYGLVFGGNLDRQYLDLQTSTPLTDITTLPSVGWTPIQDFNPLAVGRYYGLRAPIANIEFAIRPLTDRTISIDYVYQPADNSSFFTNFR